MIELTKNGFNMPVHHAPLGHLCIFGSKLMGLIKPNQKLKNLNDNKGKTSLIIQHENNKAAEGNC